MHSQQISDNEGSGDEAAHHPRFNRFENEDKKLRQMDKLNAQKERTAAWVRSGREEEEEEEEDSEGEEVVVVDMATYVPAAIRNDVLPPDHTNTFATPRPPQQLQNPRRNQPLLPLPRVPPFHHKGETYETTSQICPFEHFTYQSIVIK